MTAGNQTPPGGPSDGPVGPAEAPDGAVRPDTPAEDRTGPGDRSGAAEPAGRGEARPIPPVVPARVTMVPRDASTSAVPPNSMPPGRGGPAGHPDAPEPSDPARPADPAQPSEPVDRFPASRLFEPFTPVGRAVDATPGEPARPATPGPTVPWRPPAPASDDGGEAPTADPPGASSSEHGPDAGAETAAGRDPAAPATPATTAGSTPDGADRSAQAAATTGPDVPASSPADPPHRDTSAPDTGWAPAAHDGPHGGPATASPHTPPPGDAPAAAPPGHGGPASGPHGPPAVPDRVPPGRDATAPSAPAPAPAAAAGRLRRLPVVVLVVAVLVAGLGYVGYRQLTSGPPDGFRAVTSPGYELAVPQAWTPPAPGTPPMTVFGVPFGGAAQHGEYTCRGGRFPRAVAASALIAVPAGVGLDQAATAFARGSGEALYPGAGPQVAVGTPGERELPRATGSRVEATVRTDGSGGCRATDAAVQVLVVPRTTAPDGSVGAAVLIVSGDLRGGPPQPAPVDRDELVRVLDTAELSG